MLFINSSAASSSSSLHDTHIFCNMKKLICNKKRNIRQYKCLILLVNEKMFSVDKCIVYAYYCLYIKEKNKIK